MRISIVHSYYTSSTPSGENFAVDMQVAALEDAGHHVQLVSTHTDELAKSRAYPIKAALTVATGRGISPLAQIKNFQPDVVHVHNMFPNFATGWLQEWTGPLVATIHNFRPICANGVMFRDGQACTLCPDQGTRHAVIHQCYKGSRIATAPLAYRNRKGAGHDRLLARADRLIVLSERSRDTYLKYGIEPEKLIIVPNFIDDLPRSHHSTKPGESWLYVGRLTPEKGVVDLLERWPAHESLKIVGSGPEAANVETMTKGRFNIAVLGSMARPDLLTILPSMKGLVIPSLWAEGLPTTYLEALAAGRPVISRRGNSAADDIERWAGELVYDDTSELEHALTHADGAQTDLGPTARHHFETHFSKNVWIKNMISAYESVQ